MSGGNVNIGGSNDDASYRYKMPRLVTKIEGRGNGIKTVIVNMSDIAKALHIDPAYPTKFFGVELGAQSKYDKANDKSVVNGAHNQKDLANLLNKFIEIFILCPNCHLPEITMSVKKVIKVDCAACGHNDVLRTDHKLSTYILKNPPVASAKMKRVKENVKSREADEAVTEAKLKEKVATKVKKTKKADNEDDVVWFTDTSAEAQKARQAEEMAAMGISGTVEDRIQNIMESGESTGNALLDERAMKESLRELIEEKATSVAEIVSEFRRIQLARNLPESEKYSLLLEVVLDATKPKEIVLQIETRAELLKEFAGSVEKDRLLIGAVEKFIGLDHKESLFSRTLLVFQALYDQEILAEESILAWHDAPADSSFRVDEATATAIREKVDKFVVWLREADEDGEEAEEEEEEEEEE